MQLNLRAIVKISFYLDKRKKLVDGSFAIRLRVSIKNKGYFLIPTGVAVKFENWLDGKIIGSRLKDAQNSLLANIHTKVYDTLVYWEVDGSLNNMSYDEIKDAIQNHLNQMTDRSRSLLMYGN